MQIFHALPDATLSSESALTIGVFDGVHRGHQKLIQCTLEAARKQQRLCGVISFHPHPLEVLAPERKLDYLTSVEARIKLIERLGVDYLCLMSFTPALAATSARDFVRPLVERLRMRELVIGPDFTLGHKRQGNAEFLRALGAEWGFALQEVQPLWLDGDVVSSTRIRSLIRAQRFAEADALLGYHFQA